MEGQRLSHNPSLCGIPGNRSSSIPPNQGCNGTSAALGGHHEDQTMAEGVRTQEVACPNGHPFKLLIAVGTPTMIQTVHCPTCGIKMVALVGEIRSVEF